MRSFLNPLNPTARNLAAIAAVAFAALAYVVPGFTTEYNIYVLLHAFMITLLVALAQLMVLAVGQMNLSLGAIGGLSAVVAGGLMQDHGVGVPLAVAAALLVGTLAGLFNGLMTAATRISSLVVTLATFAAFHGLSFAITRAQPYYDMPAAFKVAGLARWGAVPVALPLVLLIVLALALFFRRVPFGRIVLAVGANERAALLAGVAVRWAQISSHAASGLLAALAGVLVAAHLQTVWPTIGEEWLLPSFTAPILGGAALAGGRVFIVGTALGVVVVTLIDNALVLLQVNPYWYQFSLGAVLFVAVVLMGSASPRGRVFAR